MSAACSASRRARAATARSSGRTTATINCRRSAGSPSYNLTLAAAAPDGSAPARLYAAGGGGKLLMRDAPDASDGTVQTAVFYGADVYAARRRAVRRHRQDQHADHRRFAAERVLRLPGDRRQPGRSHQRHRPRGRRRSGHLDRRQRRGRRSRDRQGGDQQRAGPVGRRADAVRRGQRARQLRVGQAGLPARARQPDAGDQGRARCSSIPPPERPRSSPTTPPPHRRSAPTATSTSASWRARATTTADG